MTEQHRAQSQIGNVPLISLQLLLLLGLSEHASESDRNELLSELQLMKEIDAHPHVIKLLGCVTRSGKYGKVYSNFPNSYFWADLFLPKILTCIAYFHASHVLQDH